MDKSEGRKTLQSFEWLPVQMPGVARLVKEQRAVVGDAWVSECWRRGVLQLEPGWFYAAEGALAVGVLWDDPGVIAMATARLAPRTQAVLVLRPKAEKIGT